ncbi:MAG: hypothetical protein HYX80_04970 [Chloroflexi bacterium]|nr:hypothetical protein [Chloroflexota bacterium]
MNFEARIGNRRERKMGWSTKATLVLFGVMIVLFVASYGWSCSTDKSNDPAGAVETTPATQ